MSSITRTLRNFFRIGPKAYGHQMQYMGDTKYGKLMGTDRFGNKYYENTDELPLRTRWIDFAEKDHDPAHVEPGWHAWIGYMTDKIPDNTQHLQREWANDRHAPSWTMTRGAYRPYNTTIPKVEAWEPHVAKRGQ